MPISQQELEELRAKLAALELSDDQRTLLDSVMRIARDLAGAHSVLDAEFDGCFSPGEAEVIMAYSDATPTGSVTTSITRASGSASITRAVDPRTRS
jgi:hypothetical protein